MRIDVLGVGFDNLTMAEAVERGMELVRSPGAHYVVTPNPEIVEVCREDSGARSAVNGADLVLPDGVGVIKGAAMLGTPLKEKTPGIEFASHLMGKLAERGSPCTCWAPSPAWRRPRRRSWPRPIPVCGSPAPTTAISRRTARVIAAIRRSGADVVFVCLGAPSRRSGWRQTAPPPGAHLLCGLGGSLDVFAGVVERAPKFWSDHGLEWFYRLCKEPRRIGRMMKLPLFLVHVKQEKRRR